MSSLASFLAFPLGGDIGSVSTTTEKFNLAVAETPTIIVVPTATNTVLMVAENINANLRVQQAASLTLPSLYKRAYLIANETDETAVIRG